MCDSVMISDQNRDPCDLQFWNQETSKNLIRNIGEKRLKEILLSFWKDLHKRLSKKDDATVIRRDAHIVKSTAGLLGFEILERTAQLLEIACIESQPFDDIVDLFKIQQRQIGKAIEKCVAASWSAQDS